MEMLRKCENWLLRWRVRLLHTQRGQNTVEYALMLTVIIGAVLILAKVFKPQIGSIFEGIMNKIKGAGDTLSQG